MALPALTNPEIRKLKAAAQPRMLSWVVRVGRSGLTDAVVRSVEQALRAQELIKIRFDHDRDRGDVGRRDVDGWASGG